MTKVKSTLAFFSMALVFVLAGCSTNALPTETEVGEGPALQAAAASQTTAILVIGYSNTHHTADKDISAGTGNLFIDRHPGRFIVVDRLGGGGRGTDLTDVRITLNEQLQHAQQENITITGVWWQVGTKDQQDPQPSQGQLEKAREAMDTIVGAVGNVPFYISSMTPYEDDRACRQAGPFGPAATAVIADMIVNTYPNTHRVPSFEPLAQQETTDGCHEKEWRYEENVIDLAAFINSVQ